MTSWLYGQNGDGAPARVRHLAINLRLARLRAGLTQTELAEAVGCDLSRIGRVEHHTSDPKFWLVADIARELRVRLDDLIAEPPANWEDEADDLEHAIRSARLGRKPAAAWR